MMITKNNNNKVFLVRRKKTSSSSSSSSSFISNPIVKCFFVSIICLIIIQFIIVLYHDDIIIIHKQQQQQQEHRRQKQQQQQQQKEKSKKKGPIHTSSSTIAQAIPPLPPFTYIPNSQQLINETMKGNPSIAGITALLYKFLNELHTSQQLLATKNTAENVKIDTTKNKNKKQVNANKKNNNFNIRDDVIRNYFYLSKKYLLPFDKQYNNGKSIFPIRTDNSIYISIASFRDHLLGQTLISAFQQAFNRNNIYVGVIVQNCFGNLDNNNTNNTMPCKTGAKVIGKNKKGHDMTKVFDSPPDINGIEEFCNIFQEYCNNNNNNNNNNISGNDNNNNNNNNNIHIRTLYVNETEAIGPAVARYYASKLWGGETYYMQIDSHTRFVKNWDVLLINEIKETKSYPYSILSSYPPGFIMQEEEDNNNNNVDNVVKKDMHNTITMTNNQQRQLLKQKQRQQQKQKQQYTNSQLLKPGSKLCQCEFSSSPVEQQIIRINSGCSYNKDIVISSKSSNNNSNNNNNNNNNKNNNGNSNTTTTTTTTKIIPIFTSKPKQIAFMGAGYFFTVSEWLIDVPYDPLLPWCFMGEEILLSLRSYTSGYDIYSPRINYIEHQYRPGRLGLPKFWGSVGRTFGSAGPGYNTQLQSIIIQRIKYIIGYPDIVKKFNNNNINNKQKNDSDSDNHILNSIIDDIILTNIEQYNIGNVRTRNEYLNLTKIDFINKKCHNLPWCNKGYIE